MNTDFLSVCKIYVDIVNIEYFETFCFCHDPCGESVVSCFILKFYRHVSCCAFHFLPLFNFARFYFFVHLVLVCYKPLCVVYRLHVACVLPLVFVSLFQCLPMLPFGMFLVFVHLGFFSKLYLCCYWLYLCFSLCVFYVVFSKWLIFGYPGFC